MQYHSARRNSVWSILLILFTALSLTACSDTNNVSGPLEPAPPGPLTILTSSPLPAGTRQVSYDITLASGGGTPPYTWSLASGSPALPNGLTLNSSTGNIVGTPTTVGTTPAVFKLQDSDGQSAQKALTITVNNTPDPLRILTPSLPPGVINQSYIGAALSATGGRSPYTWDIVSGALPIGLDLDPSGVISGIPVDGTSSATFRVRDSSSPQEAATKLLSITIDEPQPLRITTTSLDSGTVNAAYNETVSATGGTGTRQWAVVGGGLPPGLILNASNGNISGIPTDLGTFNFRLRVTDQAGLSAEQDLPITIVLPEPPDITTTSPLPNGTVGVPYRLQLEATGGLGALTWGIASGSLPLGLRMDEAGVISGIPFRAGQYDVTIQVIDTAQRSASRSFSFTVDTFL